jgi:hypothetical protein
MNIYEIASIVKYISNKRFKDVWGWGKSPGIKCMGRPPNILRNSEKII